MNRFRKWVEACGGPEIVAEKMGKSSRAIYKWLQGKNLPSGKDLVELRRMSKGAFSLDDVIDCCVLNKK